MRNLPGANSPPDPKRGYPAETARQGQIVLNRPWRRAVFFGGLIALFLLAIVLAVLGASA